MTHHLMFSVLRNLMRDHPTGIHPGFTAVPLTATIGMPLVGPHHDYVNLYRKITVHWIRRIDIFGFGAYT